MSFLPFSDEEAEVSQTRSVGQRVETYIPAFYPLVRGFSQENPSCLEVVQSFPLPVTPPPYTSVQAESESSSGTKECVN